MQAVRTLALVLTVVTLAAAGCAAEDQTSTAGPSGPVATASSGDSRGTAPGTTERSRTGGTVTGGTVTGGTVTGSTAEVCGRLGALKDADPLDDPAEAVSVLEDLQAAAPDEIQQSIQVFIDVVEQLDGLEDDPSSVGKAMDLFLSPEVLAAAAQLDEFAREECGLELGLGEGSGSGSGSSSGGTGSGTDVDIDTVQAHLDSAYADAPFQEALGSGQSWVTFGDDWTIQADGLDATTGLALCDAVASFLADAGVDGFTVAVQGAEQKDLATADDSPTCSPA